jgi:hypothetical protein
LGTLLQSFAANYDGSAVVVTWTLSESGEGMLLFASRAVSGTGVFRELADSKIQREGLTFRLIDKECEPGESYRYRIEVEDEQDRRTLFETEAITVPALPLTLYQIRYYLPGPARVTLEIYDITGKRIVCLVEGEQRKGLHSIEWNGIDESGNGAASGLYFYRLKAGKRAISKKMILLR